MQTRLPATPLSLADPSTNTLSLSVFQYRRTTRSHRFGLNLFLWRNRNTKRDGHMFLFFVGLYRAPGDDTEWRSMVGTLLCCVLIRSWYCFGCVLVCFRKVFRRWWGRPLERTVEFACRAGSFYSLCFVCFLRFTVFQMTFMMNRFWHLTGCFNQAFQICLINVLR